MRLVIKVGTRSLMAEDKTLDQSMIELLVDQIATLKNQKHSVALVSSGAVGAGRLLWTNNSTKSTFTDRVLEKQILASLGQSSLIDSYNKALSKHDMLAAQILLTKNDFKLRRHSVNIGRLMDKLLGQHNLIPVINENDSISVEELMFTDNDELAGLLATQIGADRLIILSDVDGVYDTSVEGKPVIPELGINDIAKVDLSMKGTGRGGMQSKLGIAKKMALIGVQTHIAKAREPDILLRIIKGEKIGTVIKPQKKEKPIKRWLSSGVQETRGEIVVNAGLAERLQTDGKACSILPVGIEKAPEDFTKGDVVIIRDLKGKIIGHGLARYNTQTLKDYIGKKNKPVFIHYNALHIEN